MNIGYGGYPTPPFVDRGRSQTIRLSVLPTVQVLTLAFLSHLTALVQGQITPLRLVMPLFRCNFSRLAFYSGRLAFRF